MADLKISALTSAGALAGTEPLPIVQGGSTKKTTAQDIANLKATPNLQQVTTAGFTTTTKIISSNGAGSATTLNNGVIDIATGDETVTIEASLVTTAYTVQLPNKLSGTETFAMLSDIVAGGVASVSAGTNISVTGTATNPIINSLADRYKTTSLTSNSISNGSKTFTVDANLAYIPLQEVLIVNSPSNHMHGEVTSYSGTTLVVDVNHNTGSGTFASWVINLDGIPIDAITGVGTANEISYFTSGQVIASLPVATYPSLTELSYVKGVTSAIQTQINAKTNTQTLTCIGLVITTVNDATNYHIGTIAATPAGTDARRAWKFTAAGTVTAASFTLEQTTNGSGETVNIYLRNVTTATDTSIGTFTSNFGASTTLKQLFSGLSIAVNTTDDYTIKISTPTWVTNPASWTPSITLQQTV
jgi:uncharacterized membrane protein